ncbi:MAG: hypothetical protein KC431_09240, partial [Myxococcales bacterium]|nr:hypothetical protein [Myxococcales bacterium]
MAASAKSTDDPTGLLPRVLQPRLAQLRLDLRAVVAGLRGERAPSWLPRDGSRYRSTRAAVGLSTRELEVTAVVHETAEAVSLVLRDPRGLTLPPLRPGQFFTVLVPVNGDGGELLRRAYSISSDCRTREQLTLTIKRVAGGRASNWLADHATAGMRLQVLGPSGDFGFEPEPDRERPRKLVLIAGGSGITPMMAMLRTLPEVEAGCELALIYGNRRREDVIFAEDLDALARRHGERLRIHHALEQPPSDWTGAHGRLDAATLGAMLDAEALAA